MDWRALAQVKELGVVVEDDPGLTADLTRQFEAWWQFSILEPIPLEFVDPVAGLRPVPCWSPLALSSNREQPLAVNWNDQAATAYTTCSSPALCAPGRTRDIDALRHTVDEAEEMVAFSVMHFAPMGVGRRPPTSEDVAEVRRVVWWPVLSNALIGAVCRGVDVSLLVSRWPHAPAMT